MIESIKQLVAGVLRSIILTKDMYTTKKEDINKQSFSIGNKKGLLLIKLSTYQIIISLIKRITIQSKFLSYKNLNDFIEVNKENVLSDALK